MEDLYGRTTSDDFLFIFLVSFGGLAVPIRNATTEPFKIDQVWKATCPGTCVNCVHHRLRSASGSDEQVCVGLPSILVNAMMTCMLWLLSPTTTFPDKYEGNYCSFPLFSHMVQVLANSYITEVPAVSMTFKQKDAGLDSLQVCSGSCLVPAGWVSLPAQRAAIPYAAGGWALPVNQTPSPLPPWPFLAVQSAPCPTCAPGGGSLPPLATSRSAWSPSVAGRSSAA